MEQTTPTTIESERDEMLRINARQKEYYERVEKLNRGSGLATRIWGAMRAQMQDYRRGIGVKQCVRSLHHRWLSDLSGQRVLDLGCDKGNSVSLDLARRSGHYVGVDLSEKSIATLRHKLDEQGLPKAEAVAMDFLSDDFPYKEFDVVYANGVMHHFPNFPAFLAILHDRLVPGGRVITFDPLETSFPIWMLRRLYRPFQKDADWEWPFTRRSLSQIAQFFDIAELQGVLGYSKWALPAAALPGLGSIAQRLGRRWHQRDLRAASRVGRGLYRCMQVAMLLKRREAPGVCGDKS